MNLQTNTSLFDLIKVKWAEGKLEQDKLKDVFAETPKTLEARELEQLLADRFEPVLEQFNQGLISASELLTKLTFLGSVPVGEGE